MVFLVDLLQLEGEGHVLIDGHVGVQSIVLEDHGDVPVLGRDVVDDAAVDDDLALGDLLKAGDHAQGGGLAAAGGADEDDELLVLDVDVELLHGDDALVGDLEVYLVLLVGLLALLGLFLLLAVGRCVGVDLLYVFQDYF